MDEKRASPRRRVLKAGRIVFNDKQSVINCTVRNLSETGALLKVENALSVPSEFTLRFDESSASCRAVRRSLAEIAVAFLSPPQPA
ncbi:MAG TPA: PilZ domain-containing protein [Devosia sp.]|nr:PilZ domain-containing protein [Devosia sp.]